MEMLSYRKIRMLILAITLKIRKLLFGNSLTLPTEYYSSHIILKNTNNKTIMHFTYQRSE